MSFLNLISGSYLWNNIENWEWFGFNSKIIFIISPRYFKVSSNFVLSWISITKKIEWMNVKYFFLFLRYSSLKFLWPPKSQLLISNPNNEKDLFVLWTLIVGFKNFLSNKLYFLSNMSKIEVFPTFSKPQKITFWIFLGIFISP